MRKSRPLWTFYTNLIGAICLLIAIGWVTLNKYQFFQPETHVAAAPDSILELVLSEPNPSQPSTESLPAEPPNADPNPFEPLTVEVPTPEKDYAWQMAYDDFMEAENVTDPEDDYFNDYKVMFDQINAYFAWNTDRQIALAVKDLLKAREFYPQLTRYQCLTYLVHSIPRQEFEASVTTTTTQETAQYGELPITGSSGAVRVELSGFKIATKTIQEVTGEIYQWLEQSYWAPIYRARAVAEQKRIRTQLEIQRNKQRAQIRTQQKRQAKAQAAAEADARAQANMNQRLEWSAENRRQLYMRTGK